MVANEKIPIDLPDGPFPFMPPISELIGWLNGPKGLHTMLIWTGQIDVDPKTLRKAIREGATPHIAKRIEDHLNETATRRGLDDVRDWARDIKPAVRGTNWFKWTMYVPSLIDGLNQKQNVEIRLPQTRNYLSNRGEAEQDLVLSIHQTMARQSARRRELEHILLRALTESTLLDSQEVLDYGYAISAAIRSGTPSQPMEIARLLKANFRIKVDFYHQLLANVMADLRCFLEGLETSPHLEAALHDHGAMGGLLPKFEQAKLVTPTRRLYEFWGHAFRPSGEQRLSFRSMAKHLPRPELRRSRQPGHEYKETADDTRLTRLKEWRSGTVPTSKQLTTFLSSLSGDSHAAFLAFVMTRTATAWTKWITREQQALEGWIGAKPELAQHISLEHFLEMFSQYPKYWKGAISQSKSLRIGR